MVLMLSLLLSILIMTLAVAAYDVKPLLKEIVYVINLMFIKFFNLKK